MIKIYLHSQDKIGWSEFAIKIIQLFTGSNIFHIGGKWKDESILIESTASRGVDLRPLHHYKRLVLSKGRKIRCYRCTAVIDERAFYEWLLLQVDKKYDLKGVIGLGFTRLFKGKDAANKFAQNKDFWCSELWIKGLRKFNLSKKGFEDMPDTSMVSPVDFHNSKWFVFDHNI